MATIYKTISSDKVTSTRTLLNENVPVTGTLLSGTYSDLNVKTYSHEMFDSIYDYPYLSSSANHLMDLTCGYATGSSNNNSANNQNSKKVNIYGQMAQVLVGHDQYGAIRSFDEDGDLSGGTKIEEAYFVNFSRLLTKDEIKKGTFEMKIGKTPAYTQDGSVFGAADLATITESGSGENYRSNSPAGEYSILVSGSTNVGLLYYQAGVAVLTASVFGTSSMDSAGLTSGQVLTSSTISANANALRNRIQNISFNNTIELNSTIYFCDLNHNEFNYSSNPTYLSGSEIIVKDGSSKTSPSSYVTAVGLYSADNELLATAKLSQPVRKDPSSVYTLRVRLDY